MSAHTAGPWEVFEHSWSDSSICGGNRNSKTICSMSIYSEATEETQLALESEMDANAHLIAAAPDLLEALRPLVGLLPVLFNVLELDLETAFNIKRTDNDSSLYKTTLGELLNNAESAINRATGKEDA